MRMKWRGNTAHTGQNERQLEMRGRKPPARREEEHQICLTRTKISATSSYSQLLVTDPNFSGLVA